MARADVSTRLRSQSKNELFSGHLAHEIAPRAAYTTEQAAKLLQFEPRTLKLWRRKKNHKLRWHRCGRAIRYLGSDLLRYLGGT